MPTSQLFYLSMKAMVNPHVRAELVLNPFSLVISWRRLTLCFLCMLLNETFSFKEDFKGDWILSLEMFSYNHDSENSVPREVTVTLLMIK